MPSGKTQSLDDRVSTIVKHAYNNTAAMKNRLDAAGVSPEEINGVADLAKIPVISKDEIVRLQASDPPFGGMLGVDRTELKWVFFSPGPLYEGVADDVTAISETSAFLKRVGFTADDVVLNAMSYHLVPFGVLFDAGIRALGGTVLPTGIGNTELQVKMMMDLGATAYIGTPSFLITVVKKAEEFGIDFRAHSRLKKAMVTAEPLPPSLRATLNDYGITVTNVYGTAELGALGYEPDGTQGFLMPEDKVVQICDPQSGTPLPNGEMGEIVATNFNTAYPIIRMGTGDLSIISGDPPRMLGWMGRSGDAVKVRGMFVHPNQLRHVMGKFGDVARFQAVITRPAERDEFMLRVELTGDVSDTSGLEDALNNAIPEVCRVRPDGITFVPAGTLAEDSSPLVDERTWD